MPEPSQSSTTTPPAGTAAPGSGEPGNNGGTTTPPSTTPPATSTTPPDLKSLPADQLAQVLENPNLWQHPRIKELVEAQRTLKKRDDDAAKATDEQLKEQNKFKELSEKQDATIAELKAKLEQGTVNQALTNKLAPLGVVDIEAALALVDRTNVQIDEATGTVKGVDEAIEALKTNKAYLFTGGGTTNPTVGGPTNPTNGGGSPDVQTFKRSQLRDPAFYNANREAILKAQAAGKIEDDLGTS